MFTLCHRCRTVYPITTAQLRQGQGKAICDRCKITFSTLNHLCDSIEETLSNTRTHSLQLPVLEYASAVAAGFQPSAAGKHLRARNDRALPSESEIPPFKTSAPIPSTYWKIGTIALAFLLMTQLIYFESAHWAQNAYFRPPMETICQWLGCKLPPYQKVTDIKVVDHSFFPARNSVAGHELHLALINHAPYPQPYPLLKISLTALDGTLIGQRIFKPEEYLHDSSSPLMPSHRMIFVQLGFAALARAVGGYQVELVR